MLDASATASTGTIRILVVEDHALTRAGLQLSFKNSKGLEIIAEAVNGVEAVDMALELVPDVVLMDIGLPLLDGVAATRKIKQAKPEIRVLMLTSHVDDEDLFSAFGGGADGYCTKDVGRDALETAIRCVATGAAWLDPAIAGRVLSATTQLRRTPDNKAKSGLQLTEREQEVLALLVDGLSNQQIAARLVVSAETIKTHVSRILEKLGVADRTQAAVKALRSGLV